MRITLTILSVAEQNELLDPFESNTSIYQEKLCNSTELTGRKS